MPEPDGETEAGMEFQVVGDVLNEILQDEPLASEWERVEEMRRL